MADAAPATLSGRPGVRAFTNASTGGGAAANVALARSAPGEAVELARGVGERLTAGRMPFMPILPWRRTLARAELASALTEEGDERLAMLARRAGGVTAQASGSLRARLGATRGGSSGILG